MQSRRMSLVEVAVSYVVGFTLAWLITFYILLVWGLQQNISTATWSTVIFTVVSVVRTYIIRRVFNRMGRQ